MVLRWNYEKCIEIALYWIRDRWDDWHFCCDLRRSVDVLWISTLHLETRIWDDCRILAVSFLNDKWIDDLVWTWPKNEICTQKLPFSIWNCTWLHPLKRQTAAYFDTFLSIQDLSRIFLHFCIAFVKQSQCTCLAFTFYCYLYALTGSIIPAFLWWCALSVANV